MVVIYYTIVLIDLDTSQRIYVMIVVIALPLSLLASLFRGCVTVGKIGPTKYYG